MIPQNAKKFARRLGCNPNFINRLNGDIRDADFLRRAVSLIDDDKYLADFIEEQVSEGLGLLLREPSLGFKVLERLYSVRILPSPAVVSYMLQGESDDLESIASSIGNGHFDGSALHKELEFSRYKLRGGKFGLTTFMSLPMLGELNLGGNELHWADKTIDEVLMVYELIMEKAKGEVPLLVIGNERYGRFFVVEPIQELLDGVKVIYEYVQSTNAQKGNVSPLGKGTWEYIAKNHPNVIVVDGTRSPINEGMARFPAAMWGYIEAFKAYNSACGLASFVTEPYRDVDKAFSDSLKKHDPSVGYTIRFWAPEMPDEHHFFVGSDLCHQLYDNGGERELLIISSSKHAYFDDYDWGTINGPRFGFSESGYCEKPVAANGAVFVEGIQAYMRERISERIKSSSP